MPSELSEILNQGFTLVFEAKIHVSVALKILLLVNTVNLQDKPKMKKNTYVVGITLKTENCIANLSKRQQIMYMPQK